MKVGIPALIRIAAGAVVIEHAALGEAGVAREGRRAAAVGALSGRWCGVALARSARHQQARGAEAGGGERQQDLRQPLLGDPGLAGEGEGIEVSTVGTAPCVKTQLPGAGR